MQKRIFITATNTDIGKTYTSIKLLKAFAKKGLKVGAIKLIETGVVENALDATLLFETLKELHPAFCELSVASIVPITYPLAAAPSIASEGKKFDLALVQRSIEKLEEFCDVVLLEGAGGLYVPLDDEYMMIDLINILDAKALLVTHCSLGCINDTLLSEMALQNAGVEFLSVFNCREENEDFAKISQPYFLQSGRKVLKVGEDIDTICNLLYNL